LAAEIEQKFGTSVQLIKGRDGVFEVSVDGKIIFSKKAIGRFPGPGEVAASLEGLLAP
jgi:selT/selW/selH-like putative selenoprotein